MEEKNMKSLKTQSRILALVVPAAISVVLLYPGKPTATAAASNTTTTVQLNDTITVQNPGRITLNSSSNLLAFKQIRVVFHADLGNCAASLLEYDGNGVAIGTLDSFGGSNQDCSFTRTYDTPGAQVAIQYINNAATADSFRFIVYGQPYESSTTR